MDLIMLRTLSGRTQLIPVTGSGLLRLSNWLRMRSPLLSCVNACVPAPLPAGQPTLPDSQPQRPSQPDSHHWRLLPSQSGNLLSPPLPQDSPRELASSQDQPDPQL